MGHVDLVVITIVAVFFAAMGVYALLAPDRLVAPFDITLRSVTARSEVRAVYGGFGLAVAAVLGVAAADPGLRAGILITVGAALGGMAFGRLTSLLDGRSPLYPNWFYLGVEAACAAVLFVVAASR